MHRMTWWILLAALFLSAQTGWRTAPPDSGTVRALDGGLGQPPPPRP